MSAETPEAAAGLAAALRADVIRRWNLAGRPAPDDLAATSGRAEALFRDFLDGRQGLNPHLQWLAMNDALPAPGEHDQKFKAAVWRWVREVSGPPTQPSLRPMRAKPSTKPATPLQGPDPLVQARRVNSAQQFNHQLRRLMIQTGTSFTDIGRRSDSLPRSTAHHLVNHERLPAREEQVRAFVQACGVGDAAQDEWVAAWQEARVRLTGAAPQAVRTRRRRRDRVLFTVTITTPRRGRACTVTAARASRAALVTMLFLITALWPLAAARFG
ncbi:hypothetical protein SAMN04488564_101803 [Lentzea waywayandensis]|uniref:Helix-turn-helix domain-containing protein n=1 Tax=Lentzea waywayandensis TaxID=84724 RepID=A0A1I6D155_9PSEU|nr:helix-turn-helix transcriptional regulator [Lentzea waywayandensis]SFQ99205.1 hypothetical protein SAMN04488564_101803 [Lentzea waywayandensis]